MAQLAADVKSPNPPTNGAVLREKSPPVAKAYAAMMNAFQALETEYKNRPPSTIHQIKSIKECSKESLLILPAVLCLGLAALSARYVHKLLAAPFLVGAIVLLALMVNSVKPQFERKEKEYVQSFKNLEGKYTAAFEAFKNKKNSNTKKFEMPEYRPAQQMLNVWKLQQPQSPRRGMWE